jgi:hypothetical protein
MEFKGTKGVWRKSYNFDGDIVSDIKNGEPSQVVCLIPTIKIERNIYDAQLITCAPEMLEMLEEFIHMFSDPNNSCSELELINEAKELVIKATTI